MSDYLLELEVKLSGNNVLDKFENQAIAAGKRIEQTLAKSFKFASSQIKLDIDTSGIKAATAEMKLLNREIAEVAKGMKAIGTIKFSRPSVGGSSSSSGTSASSSSKASEVAAQRALNAELKRQQSELGLIAKLERDVASARVAGAKATGNKALLETITLEKEALRHAQLLSKINASPLSPKAATEARNLATALNSINVNKIKDQFSSLENQASKTFGKISNLAANVAGGISGAVTSAGLNVAGNVVGGTINAVAGTVGDSASKALDFNSTLNMIKVNSQATVETMATLKASVLEASTSFGIAPTKMAEYSLELIRMGITAQELPEFLRAVGNSARASGQDFDVVKGVIASTKAVYSDLSAANVGDILTVGANLSPQGFQAIGQALSYVSANAAASNVPLETLIEQIVTLQTAGMGVKTGSALSALYTDIKENSGVIEEVGIEVFDSMGKLREMKTIINELGAALSKMSEEEATLTLKPLDTNSIRALRAIGQANENNAADVKRRADQLKAASGVSVSQGAQALQDPKAKLAQVEAQIEQLKIKLGEAFMPAIEGVLDFGGKLGTALLDNDTLFAGLTQSSQEFQNYLAANPQLVTEMATALGEVGALLSQTILTETRELLNHLQQNPAAIQQALTGMVDFATNLSSAVKLAADLVGFLRQAGDFGGKVFNNLASLVPGQNELWAQEEAKKAGSGAAPAGLTAEGQKAYALSQDPKVRALLDAITVGEGTSGENGYNTKFGGGTFSDTSRHPADIVSAGGYSSDAAGRYQFLSTTYNPVAQQLGLRDFSPQSQDIAATQLLINRGAIDPLMSGDRDKVQDRLAPEWASIPTSSGGSYYGQPVVSGSEFWGNYDRNLGGGSSTASTPAAPPIPSLSDRADGFKVTVNGQTMTFEEYQKKQGGAAAAPAADLGNTLGSQVADLALGRDGQSFREGVQAQCANFVRDVFAQSGVKVGATQTGAGSGDAGAAGANEAMAASFFGSDVGQVMTDQSQFKPGDIVGFRNTYGDYGKDAITHAGIYTGDGMMVDRSTSSAPVRSRPLSTFNTEGMIAVRPNALQGGAQAGGNGLTRLDRALTPKERQAQRDESEKKKQEAERQRLIQQARANEDQGRNLQRQADADKRKQESASRRLSIQTSTAGLAGTPFEAVGQRSLSAFDLRDKYQQEIDKYKQDLEDLQRELSRLDTRKDEPGINAVADGYKAAIAQTQSYISTLGEQYQQESKLLEVANSQAVAQNELAVRSEMAANRSARAAATMALEVEAFVSTVKDPTLQAFLRSGFESKAKGNSYAEEIRKIQEEAEKLETAIKALQDSGLDLNSPELQLSQEKLADMRDTAIELKANSDLEFKVSVTGQTEMLQQFKTEQQSSLTQARVNVLQQRGDVFGANALQRTDATRQQSASYFDQRSSIEALKGTSQESEIPGLLSNLESLNNFSLEGINNQFLTLNETMAQTAQGALKGFISDLGKGKGFADSFTSAIDNLAGSLLDMVLNQAFSSIFKGVGGGIGGGGGGGGGGIFDTILGGLTSGLSMSQGNVPNFAKGSPIDEAFRREKSTSSGRPYLAVLNDQELVLSSKQSEKFMDLGLSRVVNMAGGNIPTADKSGMGAVSVSMPMNLNISGEGGNAPNKDQAAGFAAGLQAKMQAIAFAEIAKARRPNGVLWSR